jgi:hypothetical protein
MADNSLDPIAKRTQTIALLSTRYSHAEPSLINMVVNLLERSDEAPTGQPRENIPSVVNHSKPEATHISDAGIGDSANTSQPFISFEDLLAMSPM